VNSKAGQFEGKILVKSALNVRRKLVPKNATDKEREALNPMLK
jgi:hypothetical protein